MSGTSRLVEEAARKLARKSIEYKSLYDMADYDAAKEKAYEDDRWPYYVGMVETTLETLRDDFSVADAIEAAVLKWRSSKPRPSEGFGHDILKTAMDKALGV